MTKQDSEKNKIYSNKKQEIVKPSKSMMVDTTTGMGANIFNIKRKDKPPVKSKMTEIKSKAGDHARKMYLLELKNKNKRKSKKPKFK